MCDHGGVHRSKIFQGMRVVLLDQTAEGGAGRGYEIGILSCRYAFRIFLGHSICSDSRLLRKGEAELEEHRLHLCETLQTERGDEGGSDTCHHIAAAEQQIVHFLLFAVNYLGILRAHHCAASAEYAPFLYDLRLVVLHLNSLYRALPQTFIAVLTPGLLELEILFHKSGYVLCCYSPSLG